MFLFCLMFAMPLCASVYMCFVVTCCERADHLALVCDVSLRICNFPIGILGRVWYLIVSTPDLCTLTYFDNVPHRSLLHKFDYYGIRGSTHKWINSWLCGRTQQAVLDGQASDPVPVLSCVPQGSVLGPILFLKFYKRLAG